MCAAADDLGVSTPAYATIWAAIPPLMERWFAAIDAIMGLPACTPAGVRAKAALLRNLVPTAPDGHHLSRGDNAGAHRLDADRRPAAGGRVMGGVPLKTAIYKRARAWVDQLSAAAQHAGAPPDEDSLDRMAQSLSSSLGVEVFTQDAIHRALGPGGAWPGAGQVVERLGVRTGSIPAAFADLNVPEQPATLPRPDYLMALHYYRRESESFGGDKTPFPHDPARARRHFLSSLKTYSWPAWEWLTRPDGPCADLRVAPPPHLDDGPSQVDRDMILGRFHMQMQAAKGEALAVPEAPPERPKPSYATPEQLRAGHQQRVDEKAPGWQASAVRLGLPDLQPKTIDDGA